MNKAQVHIIITVLALLVFLPGLGLTPLFDWDELNFAESAREMHLTGNLYYVQVGFEPFWEKPPLFIWLQSFFLALFGDHTFVYRLPNALAGIVTVNLAYHIGYYLARRTLGVFWALAMTFTFAPLLYFKSGIIDPVFNLFIFLSIWHWYRITRCESENSRPHWHYFLVGLFIGLAALTKGQVAFLLLGLVALIITAYRGQWQDVFSTRIFIALMGCVLVVGTWVLQVYNHLGPHFFDAFISYQLELVQGQIPWHNQPWFYHIVVLLFLCSPSAALAIPYLFQRGEDDFGLEIWHAMMRTLFWVVLIVFSIVTTKIIHYSSLCWFPLTYFAGYHTYLIHTNRGHNHWIQKLTLLVTALGLLSVMILLPVVFGLESTPEWSLPYLDSFAKGLIAEHQPWGFVTLIPAMMMLLLVFPWLIKNFLQTQWHPGKLFIGMGAVALSAYFFLLPAAESLLQNELTTTVQTQTNQPAQYVETHGFRSYALYYHGKLKPAQMQGPWLTDTFVIHRSQNNPYPKQEAKRVWIKDANHHQNARLITKSTFVADRYFRYQFNLIDSQGAYFVWQRR
ncbi:MAG: phospholipid carrier-dependent glycosyltransferase [Bacteroidetes bacterium]|nr:phospholipid carrier-dependent glycosyltransferase [Bacteroidota bacterium]